jgi:glycosyltransferase involved in cell wall biosynthesis
MASILMIAYACEPDSTSEGLVGWELASRIARRHHVTLLTRPKARADIEVLRSTDPDMDLEVEYHELGLLRSLKRLRLPVSNLRYLVWNHRLAHRVAELEQTGRFDLVHHTTWVRHWMPTAGAGAAELPLVWGPIGAAERTPLQLVGTMGWQGMGFEALRAAAPRVLSLDPMMSRTLDRVSTAVASSNDTARYLSRFQFDQVVAPSVGYDPARVPTDVPQRNEIVSAGRLLDWKGFHLGLGAFARMPDPDLRYTIVGDGPARRRLIQLARDLGIERRVDFVGRLSPQATVQRIGGSRLLVHPSVHDSGGFVVVEALAQGVPVLTLDIGGPPFLTQSGGVAVPARPSDTLVARMSQAMGTMLADRDRWSEAARRRAEDSLAWERIVDVYDGVYHRIIDGT